MPEFRPEYNCLNNCVGHNFCLSFPLTQDTQQYRINQNALFTNFQTSMGLLIVEFLSKKNARFFFLSLYTGPFLETLLVYCTYGLFTECL